ncbi:tetratricopeptide repeat protein [Thiopseudomonas denitrificans]|uniref:Sel1 repeat-containing protein n=1 Tax=Thiopseudomonas denitrificans TaxID=1501432 RepID=A0A4R6U169_9GAMM|nr:SEL1-like repeat protein [Thiopseudomonas denitrificans]TDQ39002.1 Sel1 repeat-containing protein [Thiopseudomonas denitrificans]
MTQPAISLDSAVLLATVSRRTLWRRVQDGQIGRSGTDERGRALLALADLGPLLCIRLDDEGDASLLVEADRGSAVAQNELGILCLEQAQGPVALHWFKLAAEQGHSDAMHHLSRLYLHGIEHSGGGGCCGLAQDRSQAFLWLSKAAVHGHAIAREQLAVWTGD